MNLHEARDETNHSLPCIDELRGFAHWEVTLPGDSPCGEDVSLDPDFELLAFEIGKDTSIHGGPKTDWVAVYELSDSILARSKNLWPFAYGTVAVFNTKTVKDCAACVNSLAALISSQWQHLHPSLKRPKRRVAPLKWMCDKFHAMAGNAGFLTYNQKDLASLNVAFGDLQDTLDALLPDNDLTFRHILRGQLGGQDGASLSEQPATEAKPSGNNAAINQAPRPTPATLEDIEKSSIIPVATLPQVIRTLNDYARQFGDHLLAINMEDERAYHLHRIATWTTLLQLPPSEIGGQTELSCPIPSDTIDIYTAGVNEKRFAEVLPQIERSVSKAPFWLDGQYLLVQCLEGLSATLPAFSVKHSLAQIVKRFPDLLSLKFKDGKPFASPKTITWIESFLPTITGDVPFGLGGQHTAKGDTHADEGTLLQDAIALFRKSNIKAGLELLGTVPPGKSRAFLRHCILKAKYCAAARQPQAAAQLLRFVMGKLKEWDLVDWEPELTAETISLLLSLSPKLKKEEQEELQLLLYTFSLETAIAAKRI